MPGEIASESTVDAFIEEDFHEAAATTRSLASFKKEMT